jgi:hypothetical protein
MHEFGCLKTWKANIVGGGLYRFARLDLNAVLWTSSLFSSRYVQL